jgi:enoyl-CoA hydratase/carnithine racemase
MLEVQADGPILRLSLARPAARNSLDEELIQSLLDQFVRVSPHVRVVVLTGQGSAFCAGGDLGWMRRGAAASEEENRRDALQLALLLDAIASCPAAVIARVNGACFGGGCGLAAAADIAVASEEALFAFSEVRLGLVPATISPHVFRKIGRGHARALFVTGEAFTSRKAYEVGLIHEVSAAENLDTAVASKIGWILKAGPEAIASVKSMVREPELSLEEAARLLAATRAGREAQEGISAFLERRKASYVVEEFS